MSRRVSVHHFVVSKLARNHGPGQTAWDLLDVDYWRTVPADTEFPKLFGQLDVFTRFYMEQARPTVFRVQVSWVDHPSGVPEVIGDYGPFRVDFDPAETVRDVSFRLPMIRLQGVGRHTVELMRPVKSGWRAGELVPIAHTHFFVER
ncbi:MAG: hypothetical protein C0501_19625 [Isosphaera sp.]|nr:hypothetical protein [Isosphaera sp.]